VLPLVLIAVTLLIRLMMRERRRLAWVTVTAA
jgi:hypothetical protein